MDPDFAGPAQVATPLEYGTPARSDPISNLTTFGIFEIVAGVLIFIAVAYIAEHDWNLPKVRSRDVVGPLLIGIPAVIRIAGGTMLLSHRRMRIRTLRVAESIALAGCASYFLTAIWVSFAALFEGLLTVLMFPLLNILGMIGVGFSAVVLGYLHRPEIVDAIERNPKP